MLNEKACTYEIDVAVSGPEASLKIYGAPKTSVNQVSARHSDLCFQACWCLFFNLHLDGRVMAGNKQLYKIEHEGQV